MVRPILAAGQLTAKLQRCLGDLLSFVVGPDTDLDAERPRLVVHAAPQLRPDWSACEA
jgi:hypothetical protein